MGLTIIRPNAPSRLKFTFGGFNAACHVVEWKNGRTGIGAQSRPATDLGRSNEH